MSDRDCDRDDYDALRARFEAQAGEIAALRKMTEALQRSHAAAASRMRLPTDERWLIVVFWLSMAMALGGGLLYVWRHLL